MKTLTFEKVLLKVNEDGDTLMSLEGHRGDTGIYLSPTEVHMLEAYVHNHLALVMEKVQKKKERKDLERELRR